MTPLLAAALPADGGGGDDVPASSSRFTLTRICGAPHWLQNGVFSGTGVPQR
jgi:hypothetical protein